MAAIACILIGVALEVVKANNWFIVPEIATYAMFGLGGFLALISIITQIGARRSVSKVSKRFR
jgi:uncharacterized membrane protein